MMKASTLARADDDNLADSYRRLKELTIESDAPAAADELPRNLARTIGTPGIRPRRNGRCTVTDAATGFATVRDG
jgi:hypothetical protein